MVPPSGTDVEEILRLRESLAGARRVSRLSSPRTTVTEKSSRGTHTTADSP